MPGYFRAMRKYAETCGDNRRGVEASNRAYSIRTFLVWCIQNILPLLCALSFSPVDKYPTRKLCRITRIHGDMATDIRTSELRSPIDVAEYLFKRLYQVGVRGVHGVPGDYNLVCLT
jgi:hypothetical protein